MDKRVDDQTDLNIPEMMTTVGANARAAAAELASASAERKHAALIAAAEAIPERSDEIEAANALDMDFGREKGLSDAMLDRLLLTKDQTRDRAGLYNKTIIGRDRHCKTSGVLYYQDRKSNRILGVCMGRCLTKTETSISKVPGPTDRILGACSEVHIQGATASHRGEGKRTERSG